MRSLTRRQRRAAVALALVAALFCALDVAGAPFQGARSGVQGYFGALYRGTDGVLGPARRWIQAVPHAGSDAATIAALRRRVDDLQRTAAVTAQDKATSKSIRALQMQASRGGYRIAPARVVAIGPSGGFDWTLGLDVGSRDGVRIDQTVLAGSALVGRVVRVSATSSTVLLAADPGSGVGVRDRASSQVGVVTGAGLDTASYSCLDPSAVPAVGDVLVTGPQGGSSYVAGLTVGRITAVTRGTDASSVARVRPAVSPSTLDVVGVVLVGGRLPARPALQPTKTDSAAAGPTAPTSTSSGATAPTSTSPGAAAPTTSPGARSPVRADR